MNKNLLSVAVAIAVSAPMATFAGGASDIAELKQMMMQMKSDYEQKIQALEQRLKATEQKANAAADTAEMAKQVSSASTINQKNSGMKAISSGTAFNPQISVIVDGNYYHDDINGAGNERLGMADGISHAHGADDEHDHEGHSHGSSDQGFNFRSAELVFSASVDNYFDANAMLAIDSDGIEVEEAWFQTRSLPNGFKVKAGKFLSDIGYANNQHPHNWDFVDQNLAYLNLLGDHGLSDNGVQVTWLPEWDYYTLLGMEILQGSNEKLNAEAEIDDALLHELEHENMALGFDRRKDGPRMLTAFAKFAPDLGYNHALQLGVWGAWSNQHQELHGELEHEDEHEEHDEHSELDDHDDHEEEETHIPLHALDGDSWMWGLDVVYKYDANGPYGQGDFKLQGEYLWQRKDLKLTFHQDDPALVGAERQFTEDGFYLQGMYGIAPRWQAGLRYDVVGLTNKLESNGNRLKSWDESDRWTAMLTWKPTEFSLFRLQYSKADMTIDGKSDDFGYLYLQYQMSLGSHGAHKF